MFSVMKQAVKDGLSDPGRRSRSGLSGGDGFRVMQRLMDRKAFFGE